MIPSLSTITGAVPSLTQTIESVNQAHTELLTPLNLVTEDYFTQTGPLFTATASSTNADPSTTQQILNDFNNDNGLFPYTDDVAKLDELTGMIKFPDELKGGTKGIDTKVAKYFRSLFEHPENSTDPTYYQSLAPKIKDYTDAQLTQFIKMTLASHILKLHNGDMTKVQSIYLNEGNPIIELDIKDLVTERLGQTEFEKDHFKFTFSPYYVVEPKDIIDEKTGQKDGRSMIYHEIQHAADKSGYSAIEAKTIYSAEENKIFETAFENREKRFNQHFAKEPYYKGVLDQLNKDRPRKAKSFDQLYNPLDFVFYNTPLNDQNPKEFAPQYRYVNAMLQSAKQGQTLFEFKSYLFELYTERPDILKDIYPELVPIYQAHFPGFAQQ